MIKLHERGDIYKIANSVNDKLYFGQAYHYHSRGDGTYKRYGYEARFRLHKRQIDGEKPSCPHLASAMKLYGADKFTVTPILSCHIKDLNKYENMFIEMYDTINNGYNMIPGGQIRATDEIKAKMSLKAKERWKNEEWKEKVRENMIKARERDKELYLEIRNTEEFKEKISKDRTEFFSKQENRDNMSEKKKTLSKDLPPNIIYRRDKDKVTGYMVIISIKGKKYSKTFSSAELTMEEKLELAKKHLEELKNQFM